jgi:hypothetical protein
MNRSTDDQKRRLAELKKDVPGRGLERHPSILKNLSELPPELRSPAVMDLEACEAIQTVIAFPPQIQRGWEYVPKQALLFTPTGVIHLLSSIWPDQEPEITSLKGCGLMYMKVTLLLLYGCLEIVAQGQGSPTRVAMEFNTVAWNYLSRPLRQVLKSTEGLSDTPPDKTGYSRTMGPALENLPVKFSNGVKIYGLLPGEELQELVFQPGTWKRWLYFFRRPISANTLLLLTSHYMVVIKEELKVAQGWIISYIPRNNITGIQNQPSGLWNELSVQLKREHQSVNYKLTLENQAVEAWRGQWVQHGGVWEDLPEQQV